VRGDDVTEVLVVGGVLARVGAGGRLSGEPGVHAMLLDDPSTTDSRRIAWKRRS
jgi:hypothetical protein